MKISILLFTIAMSFGQVAQAARFQVIGIERNAILNFTFRTQIQKESVGDITERLLNRAVKRHALTYEGSAHEIVSINELTNKFEKISDTQARAYGWCFSVNGVAPDSMADKVFLKNNNDIIRWFYAYSLYDNGTWVKQCVPVIKF